MAAYFTFLRVLNVITAYFALVATLQNYLSSEAVKKAHILESAQISYLASRIQCMFTLLSLACRMGLALDIHNKTCYYIAMCTYTIVLWYIYMEVKVFKTATVGPNMPSIVISASIQFRYRAVQNQVVHVLWTVSAVGTGVMLPLMTIGLFLWEDKSSQDDDAKKIQ